MSDWTKSQWKSGDKHRWATGGGGHPWCSVCGVDLEECSHAHQHTGPCDGNTHEVCSGPKSKEPARPAQETGLTAVVGHERLSAEQCANLVRLCERNSGTVGATQCAQRLSDECGLLRVDLTTLRAERDALRISLSQADCSRNTMHKALVGATMECEALRRRVEALRQIIKKQSTTVGNGIEFLKAWQAKSMKASEASNACAMDNDEAGVREFEQTLLRCAVDDAAKYQEFHAELEAALAAPKETP